MKFIFLPSMEGPLKAGDPGMVVEVNTAPKWVMMKIVQEGKVIVREAWEVAEVEKEWVIGEAWDAGCIMVAGKVDLRNAHNPEQR